MDANSQLVYMGLIGLATAIIHAWVTVHTAKINAAKTNEKVDTAIEKVEVVKVAMNGMTQKLVVAEKQASEGIGQLKEQEEERARQKDSAEILAKAVTDTGINGVVPVETRSEAAAEDKGKPKVP